MFAEAAGDQGRYLRLSPRLFLPFAEAASFCLDRLRPSFNQRFTPHAIRRLIFDRRADITKARTELGFEPTNIRDAIREAYEFHAARGAIRRPRGAVPASGTALRGTVGPR
jgi:nucleoside-diphosphate-sugar epimerase